MILDVPEINVTQSYSKEKARRKRSLWYITGVNVFPVRCELGFISQKAPFFTVTVVKTSNLT
jgi:hypothetical protein